MAKKPSKPKKSKHSSCAHHHRYIAIVVVVVLALVYFAKDGSLLQSSFTNSFLGRLKGATQVGTLQQPSVVSPTIQQSTVPQLVFSGVENLIVKQAGSLVTITPSSSQSKRYVFSIANTWSSRLEPSFSGFRSVANQFKFLGGTNQGLNPANVVLANQPFIQVYPATTANGTTATLKVKFSATANWTDYTLKYVSQ